MSGLRELKDPITAKGLEDLIYNFNYLYNYLVQLSGGQGVSELIDRIQELITEAEAELEKLQVGLGEAELLKEKAEEIVTLSEQTIQDTQDAIENVNEVAQEVKEQGEYAEEQGEFLEDKKPMIEYFLSQQNNLQQQINNLVAEGDSSPEAAQARVGYSGINYNNLKKRLDEEMIGIANGGRNLLKGSNESDILVRYPGGSAPASTVTYEPSLEVPGEVHTVLTANANSSLGNTFGLYPAPSLIGNNLEQGKVYCLSFEARTNKALGFPLNLIRMINSSSPNINVPNTRNLTGEWVRYFGSFVWDRDGTVSTRPLIATGQPVNAGDTLEIRNIQLNAGSLPTTYNKSSSLTKVTTEEAQKATSDSGYMTPLKTSQLITDNKLLVKNYLKGTSKIIRASRPVFTTNEDGSITLDMTNSQSGIALYTEFDVSQVSANQNYAYDELVKEVGIGNPVTISFDMEVVSGALTVPTIYFNPSMQYVAAYPEKPLVVGEKIRVFQTRNLNATTGISQIHVTLGEGVYKISKLQIQKGSFHTTWNPSVYDTLNVSSKSTTAQALAGTDDSTYMTPLKVGQVALIAKGNVSNSADLNDIKEKGMYNLNTSNLLNRPTDSFGQATLIVVSGLTSGNLGQYHLSGNGASSILNVRHYNSVNTTWGPWVRMANSSELGSLAALETVNKKSIVEALNEVFQGVDSGKNLIAAAITDQGVTTPGSATFQTMANNIAAINTGVPYASGRKVSSVDTANFKRFHDATTVPLPYLNVDGLNFRPKKITIFIEGSSYMFTEYVYKLGTIEDSIAVFNFGTNTGNTINSFHLKANREFSVVNNTGFILPVLTSSANYYWEAWG